MATKDECKKCNHRKDCPILYAINSEDVELDEILRDKCISYEEEQCQKK